MYLKTRVQYETKPRAAPPVATAAGNGYSSWRQPIPLLATSIKYKKPMLITLVIFFCESTLLWGSRVSFSFLILPVQN